MCKNKNVSLIFAAAALLAMTVLGSVWDYEIANALYVGQGASDNIFGIIFAFIGIIPTFVGWSFLGASIVCLSKKHITYKPKRRGLIALAVLLFVLSFFYFCNTIMMVNANAFSVHWMIAYPIGIAVILLAAWLGYTLSKNNNDPELLKTVLILAVVSLVTLIIIMSTKGIMNRPRYRFVLESSNAQYFRNWWQSGRDIKESIDISAPSDEFTSFPSGHSAYSMFAIFLFPAIADYLPRLRKYRVALFVLGSLWWGLTALSRLTVGAHYLTDVSIAGLVTVASYAAVMLVRRAILQRRERS